MVTLRHFRICFELLNESIVGNGLPDTHPRKERHQEKHRDDRHVVRGRGDDPQLMPVLDAQGPKTNQQQAENQKCPLVDEASHYSSSEKISPATAQWRSVDLTLCSHVAAAAPLREKFLVYFFLATAFISEASTTGAGPEIPPSFRMRQKWTAMKIDATSGIPMQCQM